MKFTIRQFNKIYNGVNFYHELSLILKPFYKTFIFSILERLVCRAILVLEEFIFTVKKIYIWSRLIV